MSFVHVSILGLGSLFVALPVILHLAMRQQPKQLIFPAMRFLRQREATNRRRLQLRQWILLLSRCLLILLMALALARPSVSSGDTGSWIVVGILGLLFLLCLAVLLAALTQRRGILALASLGLLTLASLAGFAQTAWSVTQQRAPLLLGDQKAAVAAVLICDTSPRMLYRDQNQTRLERCQEMASWLLRQLPLESQVAVIDSGPNPAAFAVDRGAALQSIKTLEVTYAPQPWSRRWEQALELLRSSTMPRKELYVLTDLSRGTWSDLESSAMANRLAEMPEVDVQLIDVGAENPQNDRVASLELSQATLTPGTPLQLDVQLDRTGEAGSRTAVLALEPLDANGPLIVDGRVNSPTPEVRGSENVQLSAGSPTSLRFAISSLPVGTHYGYVELTGDDRLPVDNRRYFTLHVREPWTVCVMAGPGAEASLVTEWLAPLEMRESGRAKFNVRMIRPEELEKNLGPEVAAVALLDPRPLDGPVWTALLGYVQRGGGLGLFLGRNAQSASAFNAPSNAALLPGALDRQWRDEQGISLAPREFDHPLLSVFRNIRESISWEGMPIYRHWVLGAMHSEARTLVEYSNGKPAIIERTVGQGRVVMMTTPVTDPDQKDPPPWNFLPTSLQSWPTFVLLDRMFLYLVQTSDPPLNYEVGQSAWLPTPDRQTQRYSMFTPRGDWVELAAADGQVSMPFTELPGAYRLRTKNDGKLPCGFSVNLSPSLTRLERIAAQDIDRLLGPGRVRIAKNEEQVVREMDEVRIGREFYPFLLPVLAVILGLEYVVSNRFYPVKR